MFHSRQILINKIKKSIAEKKFNLALNDITNFIKKIVFSPYAIAVILDCKELDELCILIGETVSLEQGLQKKTSFKKNYILYIASELYKYGGHTAVIEDFIHIQPNKHHVILINFIVSDELKKNIINRFNKYKVTIIWSYHANLFDRLLWLQKTIIELNPERIYLFNHHHDAVAIAACNSYIVNNLYYYHHCDHNIALGIHLPHAVHIDPHSFGYFNCRKNLNVTNNVFWPLAIPEQNKIHDGTFFKQKTLITCSSGSQNKFLSAYYYSYQNIIVEILKITQGKHIHIGILSSEYLKNIYKNLESNNISRNHFIYVPHVTSLWLAAIEYEIDLYLVSFPLGGGRACIEMMGAGIPLVFHKNNRSDLLNGLFLAYEEAFFWEQPEELYSYLKRINTAVLKKDSLKAKKHYEKNYKIMILKNLIEDSYWKYSTHPISTKPNLDYDIIQIILDYENKINALSQKIFIYEEQLKTYSTVAKIKKLIKTFMPFLKQQSKKL